MAYRIAAARDIGFGSASDVIDGLPSIVLDRTNGSLSWWTDYTP
jgi:hypothetical protein